MEHPSPARKFTALSHVVPAGRFAAGAFQKLGRRKLGEMHGVAARLSAAALRAASAASSCAASAASAALSVFETPELAGA